MQVFERSGSPKRAALWQSVAQALLQTFDIVSRVQHTRDEDSCSVPLPFELFVATSRSSGTIECAPPRCARLSVSVLSRSGECYSHASPSPSPAGASNSASVGVGVGVFELWTLQVSSRVELLELAIAAYSRALRSASGRVGSLWYDLSLTYLRRALELEHRVRHAQHVAVITSSVGASRRSNAEGDGDGLELPTELAPLDISKSSGSGSAPTCSCARCAPLVQRARSDRELAGLCARRAVALEPTNSDFYLLLAFLCGSRSRSLSFCSFENLHGN